MSAVPIRPPERLVRTASAWEGEAGRAWLRSLPERAEEFMQRWGLSAERVVEPGGNVSLVVLVRRADGAPAALKLGLVNQESEREPEALAHWDGRGSVRLLESDPKAGALLLERLRGEVSLRSLAEPKAMLEAAGVLRRLWVAPPDGHPFRTVADCTDHLAATLRRRAEQPWAKEMRPLVDEALRVHAELVADPPEQVLLHGDYHHGNVLAAGPAADGAAERPPWLAIDPKPLVGERAFDLAWLARDRLDTLAASPGPEAAARRRLRTLADALDVDRERLRGWTLFRCVEAGMWGLSVGDREDGELLLEFASRL